MIKSLAKIIALTVMVLVGLSANTYAQKAVSDNGFALATIHLSPKSGDTKSGDILSLVVEIADNSAGRAQGLMFRERLTDSDGMLFIWPDRAVRQFWMKNTPLSLDILFFDGDGVLIHIEESATPYSEQLISSLMPTRYVLELVAGDAERRQIALGDRLSIKAR